MRLHSNTIPDRRRTRTVRLPPRATQEMSAVLEMEPAMDDDRGREEIVTMPSPAGEFVTDTFDYDGGRQVTAYVPLDPPEAVVFAGDGQVLSQWGADLEAADVPSTLIVGVH